MNQFFAFAPQGFLIRVLLPGIRCQLMVLLPIQGRKMSRLRALLGFSMRRLVVSSTLPISIEALFVSDEPADAV